MLDWRLASTHFILAMTLMLWSSGKVFSVGVTTEVMETKGHVFNELKSFFLRSVAGAADKYGEVSITQKSSK